MNWPYPCVRNSYRFKCTVMELEPEKSLIQAESSDGPNSNSSDLVARVRKLLFRRMLVGIRDGRFFLGTFHCIDKQGNIILQDAVEYRSTRRSSTSPMEQRSSTPTDPPLNHGPLKSPHTDPLSSLSLLTLLFFLSYHSLTPKYHISPSTKTQFPQCPISQLAQKFLWYAPHSGFSNQVSKFKNAILMAAILNRTLIGPPVLDHHAVALGSCPKFRVSDPNKIRVDVWNHVVELLRTGR
ncbi:hypothetical protein CMV_013459 [Castanea mollissima]|uniref:Sm domain-containing protein n=1 Tax=Castanea mollissima TaxID=60419 RepID=A0A8J4RDS7_9ROSI|nr:hypothetical protein CMV_013459 [Castanea mollissima]